MNEITSLLALAALVLFCNWLIAPDVPDLVDAHKKEVAAAKVEAHQKAQQLRDAQLLDDANRMMWPIAQAHAPQ